MRLVSTLRWYIVLEKSTLVISMFQYVMANRAISSIVYRLAGYLRHVTHITYISPVDSRYRTHNFKQTVWYDLVSNEHSCNIIHISQAGWVIEKTTPPPEWPRTGTIEFRNYINRYREGLDLVLRGINCIIQDGEKVRTDIK